MGHKAGRRAGDGRRRLGESPGLDRSSRPLPLVEDATHTAWQTPRYTDGAAVFYCFYSLLPKLIS